MFLNNTNIITYISLLRSAYSGNVYVRRFVNITRVDLSKEMYFIMIFVLFKNIYLCKNVIN